MNIATFVGRVGNDAELKTTQGGKYVANFSLAIDNGKNKEPTWVKAVLWEKRAESLAEYITKGSIVCVSGAVGAEAWIDKNNQAQAKIVVTVDKFTFGGGAKGERSERQTTRRAPEPEPQGDDSSDCPF